MIDLFQKILELSLFNQDGAEGLVLIPESELDTESEKQFTGGFSVPTELFPKTCQVQRLPNGEAFISELQNTLSLVRPSRLFIFPPLGAFRSLSNEIRTQYPRLNLEEIVLKVAVETLPSGSLLGAILPPSFFLNQSTRSLREYIFSQKAVPHLIINHDHSWQPFAFNNFYPGFRLHTLIVEIGQDKQVPLKFFKYPEVMVDEAQKAEVISDFHRLCKQGGGTTKNGYGYVLREGLPPGEILLHDKYHPNLRQQLDDLAKFGRVRPLNELCDLYRGLHLTKDAAQLIKGDFDDGVPVIEGRDILADGSISYEEPRYRTIIPLRVALKAGDICLRRIVNLATRVKPSLPIAEVSEEMLPLSASDSIIILRPKPSVTPEEREILLAYLRSNFAIDWLIAQGISGVHIYANILLELPVPTPDKDLSIAIKSLNDATKQFERWKVEAEEARNQLFNFASVQDTRLHLLTVGRQARQRQEAAQLVDDFKHRIRTQFPHPIAYRWRTVESSHPNLEGYTQVLECAEVALCYLAQICILLAKSVDAEIGYINGKEGMAHRISELQRGTNLGDWISIIEQTCCHKMFRNSSKTVPFYEVLKFVKSEDIKSKEDRDNNPIYQLKNRRDALAHGRGPKGGQIQQIYQDCLSELEALLKKMEFISEYPLRYIETTRRDSLRKITHYQYRDLMGDHPLVPINDDETDEPELEAHSLYLVDRDGKLHLLRPLLSRRECPQCGNLETFYLENYEKKGGFSILKSLEQGHTARDSDISPLFRQIGLLLSS